MKQPKNDQQVAAAQAPVTDDQVAELTAQLQNARVSELRAMADYQNLVRRTQDERIKMAKFASLSLIDSLLQPLDHLFLAKEQLKDSGLDMVYQQFTTALQQEGLEEIDVMGKEFDSATMEVITKEPAPDKRNVGRVIRVTQKGYRLNGEVIRHAKVIIGE